jgi:two-component system, LytTR family, sensor kinase
MEMNHVVVRLPRAWVLGFALATAIGLLLAGYKYLGYVTAGRAVSPVGPFLDELGAAWAVAVVTPALAAWARRFPLDRPGWLRRMPAHVAGALAFGVYHTSAMWATRTALYPLAGLGTYDFGRMPLRYAMELPQQLIIFALVVALTYLLDRHRAARQRELRIAQLETELVRARLDALRSQLNPHFLFNTLNTVSSVMYENLDAADEVLSRLAELLRRAIRDDEAHEVPLAVELDTLELYLAIMRVRFGDRLDVRIRADEAARAALVPAMLLQPLVENAIEHGRTPGGDTLTIDLLAIVDAGVTMRIEVRDSGTGAAADELQRGIGLGNTAERLARLYGDAHRLEAGSVGGRGFRVRIELPFRAAADSMIRFPAAGQPA